MLNRLRHKNRGMHVPARGGRGGRGKEDARDHELTTRFTERLKTKLLRDELESRVDDTMKKCFLMSL